MNLKAYFEPRKREILPEIKDWTLDHEEHRYFKGVWNMRWSLWFWLHPSAYQLIYFGASAVPTIMFGMIALLLYARDIVYVAFIVGIFSLFYLFNLFGKIKNRKGLGDTNFYDIFLREGFK